MTQGFWSAIAIVLATVAAMEAIAWITHKYVMHGFGWGWHRSHHEPRTGRFEKNDLYAVVFASVSIAGFALGTWVWAPLFWVGVGVLFYGILYFVVHDGLVHKRLPFFAPPRRGYMKRLYQAHRLHHAVEGREGCVSFGFLYAPPVERLKRQLKERGVPETSQHVRSS